MAKKKTKAVSVDKKPQSNGKFKKGNKAGAKGKRAESRHKEKLTLAFNAAITESDMIAIAKALVKKAKTGDARAAKEVLDRCLGKPMQSLEIAGKDGGPLKLNVVVTKTYKNAS